MPRLTKLTRTGFVAHLNAQSPRKVVGIRRHVDDCVVARYVKSLFPKAVYVVIDGPHAEINGRDYVLPIWAQEFIKRVDGLEVTRVTAATALKTLNADD